MRNIQKVSPSTLKINPKNPRVIKDERYKKLVQSIKEAPWMLELRPIVVNADNMVLGGNMRLKACIDAHLKEIPVLIAEELTEEEQKEFIIKDNVGFGEWEILELNEWDQDKLEQWGLENIWLDNTDKKEKEKNYTLAEENQHSIIINCQSELEQKKLYEELENRGFKCTLMM